MLTPDRWQRVEELFDRASELPPGERDAFVATACDGDAELRAELASLLASCDGADDSLRGTVAAAVEALSIETAARAIGARLGPYRIVDILGEGGMGTVYLAERDDAQYRRKVAIKVLRHELASPQAIARFRDERQILASLDHPGIVRLVDGGETESGLPYLVMEHVVGVPFAEHARALPVRARVELVVRVAGALQYAHQKLVVHRDIKPSNIVVDVDGSPKLLDFGIAKLLDAAGGREAQTRTGMALLTPEYASPEQARGDAVSVATDVYSLGAVLYDALVGKPPQQAGTSALDTLRIICEIDPPRPSVAAPGLRRELAGDLDSITLKALRKQPAQRYPSIAAFVDDLERYLRGLPVTARDATLAYRARKLIVRHRGKLALATAIGGALATATVVSIRQARRADDQAAHAERQRVALVRERGWQELATGHPGRALPFLVEALRAGDDSGAVRFSIAEAARPFERELATLELARGITGVAATDGRIAITGMEGYARIFDERGTLERELHVETRELAIPVLAGSRFAAVAHDATVRVWSLATGALEHVLAAHRSTHIGGVFEVAAVGDLIVTAGYDGQIVAWRLATGERVATIAASDRDGELRAIAVSPDARTVAAGFEHGPVRVFDLASGVVVDELAVGAPARIRYARDGRLFVIAGAAVHVWDVARHAQIATFSGHSQPVADFDLDASGRHIATTSADGTAKVWDAATGHLVAQLVGHDRAPYTIRFSPDETRIVTVGGDNTYRVWDAKSGLQLLALELEVAGGSAAHSPGGGGGAGFLPDGTMWTSTARAVKLRRLDRAPLVDELAFDHPVYSVAVSPDERRVVAVGLDGLYALRGDATRAFDAGTRTLWSAAWNRDGTRFVAVGADGFAQLRDRDGALVRELVGHVGTINRAAWSRDGARVITAGDDGIARIWDPATGAVIARLAHPARVLSAAFSRDGARVATAGWDRKLRVWNATTFALALTIDVAPTGPLDVAFSPDGRRLASTGHGGELDIWNAATGAHELSLVGHAGPVTQAAWSRDGELIATGSSDATARLWDARTGKQLAIRAHDGEVLEVSWSRDGTKLFTACSCSRVAIWDVRRDARSLAELDEFVAAHVPYRVVEGRLELADNRP